MNIATFVDVIDAYPKPCRLAFYLTLEIVNIVSTQLLLCSYKN